MHLQRLKKGNSTYFYVRRKGKPKVYLGRLHTYRGKACLPATRAYQLAQDKGIPSEEFFKVKGLSITMGRSDRDLPEKARAVYEEQAEAFNSADGGTVVENWQGVCDTLERIIEDGPAPWAGGVVSDSLRPEQQRYLMARTIKNVVGALDELRAHDKPKRLGRAPRAFKDSANQLQATLSAFNMMLNECRVKMHPFVRMDWKRITTRLTFDSPEPPLFEDANLIRIFLCWLEDGGDDPRLACCKACGRLFVKAPAHRVKCRPGCKVKRQTP